MTLIQSNMGISQTVSYLHKADSTVSEGKGRWFESNRVRHAPHQRRRRASTPITHNIFTPAFTEPEIVPDTFDTPIRRR